MTRIACAFVAASVLFAQGTEPKKSAPEYPARVSIDAAEIGAEYMVRSIGGNETTVVADDYLVVEIAVFPAKGREVPVSAQNFQLRLNGKKQVLHAQTPGIVAASMKYPDWERRPELNVEAGAGDTGVIIGRSPQVGRFPGDQRPTSSRLPRPVPRVPTGPEGRPEAEPLDPTDFVNRLALPEGTMRNPVSGYVFFAWRGKLKSIRTVDLLVRTESGETVSTRLR